MYVGMAEHGRWPEFMRKASIPNNPQEKALCPWCKESPLFWEALDEDGHWVMLSCPRCGFRDQLYRQQVGSKAVQEVLQEWANTLPSD